MTTPSTKPKFSVIIPTYNRANTIFATLDAIFEQSLQDFEVIVVDDGSTDSTYDVLQKIKDPRLKVYRQENSGAANARSNACDKATGEWLAFVDSDDRWHDSYLTKIEEAFETFTVDMVFTNYFVEGENEPRIFGESYSKWLDRWTVKTNEPASSIRLMSEDFYIGLLNKQPIFISAFAINRTFYNTFGGINKNLGNLGSEDSHLTRRGSAAGRIAYIDSNLVTIGRQLDNLSSNYLNNLIGGAKILEKLIKDNEIPDKYIAATKLELMNHYIEISDQAYWAGDLRQCLAFCKKIPIKNWSIRTWRNFLFSLIKQRNSL